MTTRGITRGTFLHVTSSLGIACLGLLVAVLGCSRDPGPDPSALQTGTIRAAATATQVTCPAIGSCVVLPDRDTTVYSGAPTKDYGKSHELCVGKNANSA